MSLGRLIRLLVLAAAVIAGAVLLIGSLATRRYRTIRMSILAPAGAELRKGSAVVSEGKSVGAVTRLDEAVRGLPLEVRAASRYPTWIPVVLKAGDTAVAGEATPRLTLTLDASDTVLTLASEAGESLVLHRLGDTEWRGVRSDGDTVRAIPGDVIAMPNTEIRLGSFGEVREVEIAFATRKLCPDYDGGWFPSADEQAACRGKRLTRRVKLDFGGTLGLTKPVLKLSPASDIPTNVIQPDSTRIPLVSRLDLPDELNQILRYLNTPESERAPPVTHFEHTLARVNKTLVTAEATLSRAKRSLETVQTSLEQDGGVGALALGKTGYGSLQTTLANVRKITDTTTTLVENVGLGRVLAKGDTTMTNADSAIAKIQAQVDRLAPRVELAMEGISRTIEGAEGTLVSLKAAGEDIQSIKRGAQASKKYAVLGGALVALTQIIAGIAGVIYIIP